MLFKTKNIVQTMLIAHPLLCHDCQHRSDHCHHHHHKGSPPEIVSRFKGALPVRGGVSTLARMVWGTLSAPNQMGNLLDCGGVKMLARMVWGTYAVKIEVQMGNCLIVEESKMLARMVWGTYNHQHGILTKLLNSVPK